MLTISAPCPRCFQPKTTFQLVFADPTIPNHLIGNQRAGRREAAFRCVNCLKFVAVTLWVDKQKYLGLVDNGSFIAPKGNIDNHDDIVLMEIAPEMPVAEAPESCPGPVSSAFLDGAANLGEARWTAAASCYRIAIDRASKLLWQAAELDLGEMPHNLGKRIKRLGAELEIPQSLLDWLDVVKAVGNDQHEIDDVSEDDARDAAHFAEVFLTYTYTLPERLRQFRARREPDDDSPAEALVKTASKSEAG